jgi:hypothetical protein
MENKEIILQLKSIGKEGSLVMLNDEQQQAIDLACEKLAQAITRQQVMDIIKLLLPLLIEAGKKIIDK